MRGRGRCGRLIVTGSEWLRLRGRERARVTLRATQIASEFHFDTPDTVRVGCHLC
jgi:hypothetical protein